MAAGDITGDNAIVRTLVAGAAVAKGQLVDMQLGDGYFDPSADTATGKFAVAIEAASGATVEFRAVVFGEVEVTATAVAIPVGAIVIAGGSGLIKVADTPATVSENVGTAMNAFASGGTETIFVGLVN